jgi:histidine phosphotransfer protein HptB
VAITLKITKAGQLEHIRSYLCAQFNLPTEQVEAMLPGFMATLAAHMTSIEKALREDELVALGRAAHTLKGALLNLGVIDGAEIAQQIEANGKAGDRSTDYATLVAELRESLAGIAD